MQLRLTFFTCALVSIAALLRGATAKDVDPTVVLPAVTIEGSVNYRPIEEGWYFAELPGLRLYAHDRRAAVTVAERCQSLQKALPVIWPQIAVHMPATTTLIVCAGAREFRAWNGRPESDLNAIATILPGREGPVLVIDGDATTYMSELRLAVGRAYALAMLQRVPGMPRWFAEGLAQIAKNADVARNEIVLGRRGDVEQALNAAALSQLQSMLGREAAQSAFGATGFSNVTVDGMRVPYDEALRRIELILADQQAAGAERGAALSYAEFFEHTREVPLATLFDPAARESLEWRMTAWEFVHLGLFGAQEDYRRGFTTFNVQQAERRPTEEAFKNAFGKSTEEFAEVLRKFGRSGRYKLNAYKISPPLARNVVCGFAAVGDREILPLKAAVLRDTQRGAEARTLLRKACAYRETRSAESVSQLAALASADEPAAMLRLLEDAAKTGPLTEDGYYWLAKLRFDEPGGARPLDAVQTVRVLTPAFEALKLSRGSAELYRLVTDVWLASAVKPQADNLDVPLMGARLYPQNTALRQRTAELLEKHGRAQDAAQLRQ